MNLASSSNQLTKIFDQKELDVKFVLDGTLKRSFFDLPSSYLRKKKTRHRDLDMFLKQSIGVMSPMEYKRRTIINKIYHLAYVAHKTSLPLSIHHVSPVDPSVSDFLHDSIICMEVDPIKSRCLLTISRYNHVIIYLVSNYDELFGVLLHKIIPHRNIREMPNSTHWLWDCTVFSVGAKDDIHFWDTNTCKRIETIRMRTQVLNHVFAAKKNSRNKYVGVTGIEGHVFLIDLRFGQVVTTMQNIESSPVKAIDWHPYNELKYITGNNNGNMFLWDIRFQNKFVFKFSNDDDSLSSSHFHPVVGLKFYNDGHNVISIDENGYIKTWEMNTGTLLPNYYERLSLSAMNQNNTYKGYQFAVTEHLKQDFAFFPSAKGIKIINIDSGEVLPNSEDIRIPINCVTYDSQKVCVYGGYNDVIKLWDTQPQQLKDD